MKKKKNTSNIHIFNEWFISDHCPEHQQSFQSSVGEEAGASDLQWNWTVCEGFFLFNTFLQFFAWMHVWQAQKKQRYKQLSNTVYSYDPSVEPLGGISAQET